MPVQFVQAAYLPRPATCVSCGSVDRDCLDFGVNVDRFGAVLLCTSCVNYAVLEYGKPLNAAPLDILVQTEADLAEARNQLDRVPRALEALNVAVGLAHSQFDSELRSDVPVVREPEEPAAIEPGPSPAPAERKPRGGRGKAVGPDPAPERPAGEPGPDDLPGDSGDTRLRGFDFDF